MSKLLTTLFRCFGYHLHIERIRPVHFTVSRNGTIREV